MTERRRQEVYGLVFAAMLCYKALSLPLDIEQLCKDMGIELRPLSQITRKTGLTKREIFDIWGNKDGAVCAYQHHYIIAYNDLQPSGRVRFTLGEEICHIICGHVEDCRFTMFNQTYSEGTYQQYEEEARIGAGILLCQPQYFFANLDLLTPDRLAQMCGITGQCAIVRCDILSRFRSSICRNPLFSKLPMPRINTYDRKRVNPAREHFLDWDSAIGF